MSEDQSGQQHVIVVGPDGQPVAVPAEAVTQAGGEEEGDDLGNLTDLVEQPAKVMRIGSMIRQLLEEVKSAPLDDASRNRLKEIHRSSIKGKGLCPGAVRADAPRAARRPESGRQPRPRSRAPGHASPGQRGQSRRGQHPERDVPLTR